MKALRKTLFWTGLIAIYLNLGWTYGVYMSRHTMVQQEHATLISKFMVGPHSFLEISGDGGLRVMSMFFWPFFFVIQLASWIIYGIYWILWLVFAGGIAKLLGAG